MIDGIDTARYQGTGVPGAFEIINAEDPTLPDKVAWNVANGRPWGVYIWVYAGTNVRAFTGYWITHITAAFGEPPAGWWADYEEAGVGQADLDGFFAGCTDQGVYPHSGKYGNEWRLPANDYPDRPFWDAGYPDPNDGVWRNYVLHAGRPVAIWQWTSGGGLDQDVILDEGWWAAWVGGTPTNQPSTSEEDDMRLFKYTDDSGKAIFCRNEGFLVALSDGEAAALYPDVISGAIKVTDLGGTLGAVAWNVAYRQAHDTVLPSAPTGATSPPPSNAAAVQAITAALAKVSEAVAALKV